MTNQTDPAALVKAVLERAAEVPFALQGSDALVRAAIDAFESTDEKPRFVPAAYAKAIRALADDPAVVAEIIEQAKGENDE